MFNPLELDFYNVNPGSSGKFNQYELVLNVHVNQPGNYSFQDLSVQLSTSKGQKELHLGDWNIKVVPKSTIANGIIQLYGTGGTQGFLKPANYQFEFAFKNNTSKPVIFQELEFEQPVLINQNETISFDKKIYHPYSGTGIVMNPGSSLYYRSDLHPAKNATGFTELKPGLVFQVNGKRITVPIESSCFFTLFDTDSTIKQAENTKVSP